MVFPVIAWLMAVMAGMAFLINYESRAGQVGNVPDIWPPSAGLEHRPDTPHLLMFVHPRCPCSRASIEELSRLIAICKDRVSTRVVVLRPDHMDATWTQTDLVASAQQIPGVDVVFDHDGHQARCFGVSTSGHSLLYATDDNLIFSGGITASRGHAGDNPGSHSIVSLVCPEIPGPLLNSAALDSTGAESVTSSTCVFGCPLFEHQVIHQTESAR